ncbi:DHHA1 domain-containing protein [Paenibacillus sp. BSR1-1]|uniref:DHH family phosphoesterase n=1 Tax=Paenibacillus sp. BSR1-1 TaxID=3020845 RepID=UPI0025AF97D7|nr:DHHA1 domain-containing protein [Paenibacillus sp. BSR1-1]MDN3018735.1 DHHA1 domain-containing protein [Paenibacillus sp. BSR1-1]
MVKLFTDIDLDGLGCGLIAKIAFGEKADVAYCSYRNLNQRVEAFISNLENNAEEVYITDLAVNNDVEKKLAERFRQGKHIQMIDHHATAMHFNEYKWASVRAEYETGKKTCATSLFYDFLVEHGRLERNKALEEFIDLVRQYDTWEWDENDNIKAKRLNDLFYIRNREQFEEEMLKRLTENRDSFDLTETENMLLDIEEQKISRYIQSKSRQMVQTFVGDYCVGIVHAEQYLSELGNALNNLYPYFDMIALLNVGGKKMGFRTIHDDVNVAQFAQKYGGGGHPKASGADLTAEAFETFIVGVFNLSSPKPDADRNEFNVKEASYGSSYQNHKGEISFIQPKGNSSYIVFHNGEKLNQSFLSYAEAERFLKRNYASWLRYDKEYLPLLAKNLQISLEEIKEKYPETISNRIVDIVNI